METFLSAVMLILLVKDVQSLTLLSPLITNGSHISACPNSNVLLTCSDTEVTYMQWLAVPGLRDAVVGHTFLASHNVGRTINDGSFTLTLVHVAGGNLTSTMEVMANDLPLDGTTVTCITIRDRRELFIDRKGPPFLSNVTARSSDFQTDVFVIILSWDSQNADTFTVSTNLTAQQGDPVYINLTTHRLEATYNTLLLITITAVNCAGTNERAATLMEAGCSPPSPPVNGSVSEFTSSRVGAQVTYSCDTDLVLVGERVATCSETSLQWLPSSEDIICVQPPVYTVCGDPHENLTRNASISSLNGSRSVVTFSCDPGYSLHGSTTSQCVSGEWTPSPETVMCVAINRSITSAHSTSSTTAPSTPSPPSHTMTPTPSMSTAESSGPPVAAIVAPLVVLVAIAVTVIVLGIVLYKYRPNQRKKPQTTNTHAQEFLLSRPDSRASTTATSTAPSVSQSPIVGTYDLVRPVETTLSYEFVKSTETSLSGTSPTPLYSEANNAMRTFELGAVATPYHTTEEVNYSATGPTHKMQRQQYTDVSIENQVLPPPFIDPTGEPCKYATLDLSSLVPPDPNSTKPAGKPKKHPLDKAINFDQVIQQLQPLTPYWLTLGETARLHSKQLADISQHCQGDDHQSLIEMMSRIYVPGQTTWSGIAELCRAARFTNIADSLMKAYDTGVLPIQVEDDVPVRVSPSEPPPTLPPRGMNDDEDDEPPALPPPLAPGDIPPPDQVPEKDNVLPLPPRNKDTAPVKPPRLPPKH